MPLLTKLTKHRTPPHPYFRCRRTHAPWPGLLPNIRLYTTVHASLMIYSEQNDEGTSVLASAENTPLLKPLLTKPSLGSCLYRRRSRNSARPLTHVFRCRTTETRWLVPLPKIRVYTTVYACLMVDSEQNDVGTLTRLFAEYTSCLLYTSPSPRD